MSWWKRLFAAKLPALERPLPDPPAPVVPALEVVEPRPVVLRTKQEPRGIRNHNPGNIRHGAKWQGMADVQSDAAFVTFKAPEWGIRAMARILVKYQSDYGLHTVRAIIHRWAPPVENDTDAYVLQVAKALGVDPDQPIDVWARLPQLIPAIIKHENGKQPYSAATIQQGIDLA